MRVNHIETWWDIADYRGELRRSRKLRLFNVGVALTVIAILLHYATRLI